MKLPCPVSSLTRRLPALVFATVLWFGGAAQNVRAGDALTTSSDTTTTKTSLLKSLFTSSSSSSSSSSTTSSSSQLSRGILGLPFGLAKTAISTVSKAASSTVTKHITHN